jgi:hypothetical protein
MAATATFVAQWPPHAYPAYIGNGLRFDQPSLT